MTGDITTLLSTSLNAENIALSSGNILTYGANEMFDFSTVAKATYTHTGTGTLNWVGSSIATSNTISSNASTATADTITDGAGNDVLPVTVVITP